VTVLAPNLMLHRACHCRPRGVGVDLSWYRVVIGQKSLGRLDIIATRPPGHNHASFNASLIGESRISTTTQLPKPRVLLTDDHVAFLEAARCLLDPACDVVGVARDGRQALAMAKDLQSEVVAQKPVVIFRPSVKRTAQSP
jgi:hypothetical protein